MQRRRKSILTFAYCMDVQYSSPATIATQEAAMPHAATVPEVFSLTLMPFERTFIRTVLEHRGVDQAPSLAEFTRALDVLRCFNEQRQDNPSEAGMWVPAIDDESIAALKAKAYLMFGATKPTPAQWHKAHAALFGPLLCDTCG